jgi:hypothetical protein
MANGDILHADVEGFINLGRDFPATSTNPGVMIEAEADSICQEISSEVNLALNRLGFGLPLSNTNNINWARNTKLFGASAIILDGLLGQDTEEGNTRAQRYWDRYINRLSQLMDSGGDILDGEDKQTDPRPSNMPLGVGDASGDYKKRNLRFPQRAAADQYTDERETAKVNAPWKGAIAGH